MCHSGSSISKSQSLRKRLKQSKGYFVSTDTFDNAKWIGQHQNVVEAAKAAEVGHVYYSSHAFGGLGDSKVELQQAHSATERMLKESEITYTSVRMGVYADAYPCFLNWYPTTRIRSFTFRLTVLLHMLREKSWVKQQQS